MKPSKQERKTSSIYVYTTEELLKKINNIQQGGSFKLAN
jgi:hypothetical protein